MSIRGPALRVLGLSVAAIVLMAATQLLLLSFETDPLFDRERVDSIAEWIRDRPRAGAAILVGIALGLIVLWLVWAALSSWGTDRRVITTRRRGGWTKIDRATLEDAVERRLEAVDRRSDVRVGITRRGRVDLKVTTPDPARAGPVQELRDATDDLCSSRSLPCRSGRITVTVPRRITARRRVR